jgi:hypothetical protein
MSEQDRHTPGPWRFDEHGDDRIVGDRLCVALITLGVDDGAMRGPIFRANANLIAAAPELLEALKGLRALIIGECGASTYECIDGERADAAIRKAEGA